MGMKSIENCRIDFIDVIKRELGAAIRAKGGTVNDTDAWSAFVSAVNGIQLGKKWASGTVVTSSGTLSFTQDDGTTQQQYYFTVTGLTFKPSVIIATRFYSAGTIQGTIYKNPAETGLANSDSRITFLYGTGKNWRETGNAVVSSTGFTLPTNTGANLTLNWIAFE